ncbi:GTPase HflX [Desulfosporosinus nitroreducens]|uniref:GTPase HflX n=1 Tax=Desulfosporosinus nitroreducens TaxID=2018668 RepID=A0ABT8QJ32_9FIRM|nr:GTPase HflX [Desulfosporosinus nitroreducens]MDO0821316.1 GTPase HflX [Desulfosporosinus nitroreducens]
MDISGDLSGIRASQLQELKKLADIKTERSELIHPEILKELIRLTQLWNREIAIYLSRAGILLAAAVGRHATVTLPPIKGRSIGKHLRCIHTHPNGNFKLSPLDHSALESLRLESMASVGALEGDFTGIQIAFRTEENDPYIVNLTPQNWHKFDYNDALADLSKIGSGSSTKIETSQKVKELAFLIALEDSEQETIEDLKELRELARTAGVDVVGQMVQLRRYGQARSYFGSGKLEELIHRLQETEANVLICDDELSPTQSRTLEMETGLKVLDRTGLILDIFAQRAQSREGKLQVELAQLKHLLPFLTGQGQALSRLGAGVGSRGPGETKLELDRRRMRDRINQLEKELKLVLQHRDVQRRQRTKSGMPIVALVGYTNTGKTTFMKMAMEQAGSRSDLPVGENKLFATLDPIVRSIKIDSSLEILLSDTVGFIRKLPTQLLRAFIATLEEVKQADVLIHVVDASHPQAVQHAETVREVLNQLECADKPMITLLNKVDQVTVEDDLDQLAEYLPYPIKISLIRRDSLKPVWKVLSSLLS